MKEGKILLASMLGIFASSWITSQGERRAAPKTSRRNKYRKKRKRINAIAYRSMRLNRLRAK